MGLPVTSNIATAAANVQLSWLHALSPVKNHRCNQMSQEARHCVSGLRELICQLIKESSMIALPLILVVKLWRHQHMPQVCILS